MLRKSANGAKEPEIREIRSFASFASKTLVLSSDFDKTLQETHGFLTKETGKYLVLICPGYVRKLMKSAIVPDENLAVSRFSVFNIDFFLDSNRMGLFQPSAPAHPLNSDKVVTSITTLFTFKFVHSRYAITETCFHNRNRKTYSRGLSCT